MKYFFDIRLVFMLSALTLSFATATVAFATNSETTPKLMIIEDNEMVDAQTLVDDESLAYSIDRNSKFCFEGNVDTVVAMMKAWNKEGHFFSGGGGSYTIEKLYATKKGFAGRKINLVLRSEVTDEIEDTIYILRCR